MKLAEARVRSLLSQQQLAEKAQVSPTTVNGIENGKTVASLRTVRKLTAALGINEPAEIDEFRSALDQHTKGRPGKVAALAS